MATENPEVSYSAYNDGTTSSSQPMVASAAPGAGSSRSDALAVVKSPVFLLHVAEWIFSIVVMATTSNTLSDPTSLVPRRLVSGSGFVIFVGAFAFLASTTFIVLMFLGRRLGAMAEYQQLATFIFGALWALLYFVAGIVMATGANSSSASAASAFSFLSVPLWGVSSFYGFRANTIPLPFLSRYSRSGAVPQATVSV